ETAAREHGITFRAETEVSSDDMHDMIRENVTRRLAEDPSIDGYVCGSIASTLAVIAAAEAAGREIGKTIQIATKEAVPFIQLMRKDIISLSEDVSRAGTFLAQAVIQAISDPELPPMQELEIPEDDEAPDTAEE
ncbi:MAG: transcriptional regulator, partial [Maritimibacter sp.]